MKLPSYPLSRFTYISCEMPSNRPGMMAAYANMSLEVLDKSSFCEGILQRNVTDPGFTMLLS